MIMIVGGVGWSFSGPHVHNNPNVERGTTPIDAQGHTHLVDWHRVASVLGYDLGLGGAATPAV